WQPRSRAFCGLSGESDRIWVKVGQPYEARIRSTLPEPVGGYVQRIVRVAGTIVREEDELRFLDVTYCDFPAVNSLFRYAGDRGQSILTCTGTSVEELRDGA